MNYKLTGQLFSYFRITKDKAVEFLQELEVLGYIKKEISLAFSEFELNNNEVFPKYWKQSIMFYLKKLKVKV